MEDAACISMIFDKVKAAGAEADLIVTSTQTLTLKAQNGVLDEHKVTASRAFGLRTLRADHVGIAYSEADDEESLLFMVKQALINGDHTSLKPEQKLNPDASSLMVDDPVLCPVDDVEAAEKISALLAAEKSLLSKTVIETVPYNGVTDCLATKAIFSTNGLTGQQQQRTCGVYFYPLAKSGEKSAMGFGMHSARSFSGLDFAMAVEQAYLEASGLLAGEPIPTGNYDVILSADNLEQLMGAFSLCWSGKSAKDQVNPWRASVGKVVANERLTVKDIPANKEGFAFCAFDDEGVPCDEVIFLEQGKLKTFAHNTATARFFKTQTTGHAARAVNSGLGVSPHQLEICPGDDIAEVVYAGRYFEITGLEGVHSGTNAISGDFSMGASGYLVEEGRRVSPVRGVTIAGNFYTLLNQITAIGQTSDWTSGYTSKFAPVRFSGVNVSGK